VNRIVTLMSDGIGRGHVAAEIGDAMVAVRQQVFIIGKVATNQSIGFLIHARERRGKDLRIVSTRLRQNDISSVGHNIGLSTPMERFAD